MDKIKKESEYTNIIIKELGIRPDPKTAKTPGKVLKRDRRIHKKGYSNSGSS